MKMTGILFAVIAGVFIALQGVFNTRVSEKIGLWETNAVVMGIGFILATILAIFFGNGNLKQIIEVNKLYLLGGVFGVVIVYCIMKGITIVGPTYSIAVVIIVQLIVGMVVDCFGLFEIPQIKFHITKPIGIIIMIIGLMVFRAKG